MTEQEKTIAQIFDKTVEALGIMTKSLCDAIKSTKTDLQTDRLYTAEDMEAFALWSYKQSYRMMWNEGKYIGYSGMLELWEQERREK